MRKEKFIASGDLVSYDTENNVVIFCICSFVLIGTFKCLYRSLSEVMVWVACYRALRFIWFFMGSTPSMLTA